MIPWSLRLVTGPIEAIWDDDGLVATRRLRALTLEDIRSLLRLGAVRFVVADVGKPFRWVAEADRFTFWRNEVQPHLGAPDLAIDLDTLPDARAYLASEWAPLAGPPVVLLEAYH